MEICEYIDMASRKAGGITALSKVLGIMQPSLSATKAGKRPLPISSVVILADYIKADLRAVIAANELATEKDADKREFWRPFVTHAHSLSFALAMACVISIMTPKQAEAAPALAQAIDNFFIMLNRLLKRMLVAWQKTRKEYAKPHRRLISLIAQYVALCMFAFRVRQVATD